MTSVAPSVDPTQRWPEIPMKVYLGVKSFWPTIGFPEVVTAKPLTPATVMGAPSVTRKMPQSVSDDVPAALADADS